MSEIFKPTVQISVVSPVYMAETVLSELVDQLLLELSMITKEFEIILVEDGSPDNSWSEIQKACARDHRVKGFKLSRNFGQHYAITAGLANARGEWIVVMDCDLQDRPDQIIKLYQTALEGNDIVFAQRAVRQDNLVKKIGSKVFYRVFGFLTNTKQDHSIANFGIYKRQVIEALLSMKDHIRYLPTMVQWVGFKRTDVSVQHDKRPEGKSSYSIRALFRLGFHNVIAFSDKPLWLSVQFGLLMSLISSVIGIYYLVKYLNGSIEVLGFTSLIVSIWFLSGIIIFVLGVVGIYVGNTFEKVKDRPIYIIEDRINAD